MKLRLPRLLTPPLPPRLRVPVPAPTPPVVQPPRTGDQFQPGPTTGPSQPSGRAAGGPTRDATTFGPYLLTQAPNACGTTAAAMIANFWRNDPRAVAPSDIDRTVRTVSRLGSTPGNLADWYNANGFRAAAVNNATLDQLASFVDKGVPVQVEIDPDGNDRDLTLHFVNVLGVNRGPDGQIQSLRVADPNGGQLKTIDAGRFKQLWDELRISGQRTGFNNTMIVALPRDNTAVRGADGQVRMTNDIALPQSGGFGGRAQLIEGLADGANLLSRVFRGLRG